METISVQARRVDEARREAPLDLAADLAKARLLATLLDSQFNFLGIKFGLDAIVGLVPVVGDTITTLAGVYPIHLARKHGLGKWIERKMMLNLAIDYFGGIIPVVGDVFDVAYKANLKNLALLEDAVAKRGR
jgi:hypothetical protein